MGAKKALSQYEFIVNTSKEFMTMIDTNHQYVAANKAYCMAHAMTQEQVVGKTITDIWGDKRAQIIQRYVGEYFTGREVNYESWFDFPALGNRCFEVYCYPYRDNDTVTHIVVISRDITNRKEMERKVFVDPLTGIYNYRYFNQRLTEELDRAKRYNHPLSLLFADIDFFKDVNTDIGHHSANEVLQHIAKILSNSTQKSFGPKLGLRKTDIVARFGGEEFIVLAPETPKNDAISLANRIRTTVESYNFPHLVEYPGTKITISIGVAAYPDDDIENPGELLKKADLAMYEAKHNGRNNVLAHSQ